MSTTNTIQTLSCFSLFKGFSTSEISEIVALNFIVDLEPEEVLIEPGKVNNRLFVLVEGELSVILEKDNVEVAIPISTGECLGEMSLVIGNPTSAKAVAHKASKVLSISEESFWNLLASKRSGVQNLLGVMARRLQRNNDALIEKVQQQLKYQLLEKEMESAGNIQSGLVPDGTKLFADHSEVEAFALINQARNVGGDFYDAISIDDHNLYFAIGDVSGKGMAAALFMMRILTSMRLFLGTCPAFKYVLPAVNNWLTPNNDDMMFVSVFAGVLNIRSGRLEYINAGHNPPFVSLNGRPFEIMDLPKGPLVGILHDATFPVSHTILKPGDTLMLYTDGITEARAANESLFDEERVQQALTLHKDSSIENLVHSLESSVEKFVGEASQVDDYTLFGLRWLGNK